MTRLYCQSLTKNSRACTHKTFDGRRLIATVLIIIPVRLRFSLSSAWLQKPRWHVYDFQSYENDAVPSRDAAHQMSCACMLWVPVAVKS